MGLLTNIDQSNLKIENGKEDFFYQFLRLENEKSDNNLENKNHVEEIEIKETNRRYNRGFHYSRNRVHIRKSTPKLTSRENV